MPSAWSTLLQQGIKDAGRFRSTGQTDITSALIQGTPALEVNRERVATVLYEGFAAYDFWSTWRPRIFAASIAGALGSGYMVYRRRKAAPEAWALWAGIGASCTLLAWFTRPSPYAVAPPVGADQAQAATFDVLGYIDQKRAELKASDPAFPGDVLARFDALPVVQAQLDQSPLLKAVAS